MNDDILGTKKYDEENPCQRNERGASLVEYALLVALIAVICLAALGAVGIAVSTQFSSLASTLS